MSLTMRSVWILLGLSLLARGAAYAQAAAEKEVRARREAMEKAMNDRKAKEVMAYFDPSFTWKTKDGKSMDYKQTASLVEQLVGSLPPGVTIQLKIDKLELKGDTATLTVTETTTGTDAQGNKQEFSGRSREVWKKLKGKWMLVANEEL